MVNMKAVQPYELAAIPRTTSPPAWFPTHRRMQESRAQTIGDFYGIDFIKVGCAGSLDIRTMGLMVFWGLNVDRRGNRLV
jgi:hypothetical protein